MIIIRQMKLEQFTPWGAARTVYNNVDEYGLLSELEGFISDLYPSGIEETELNDLLWTEEDWIYETLDIDPYNELG